MAAVTAWSLVLTYGFALWLGLYLVARDPRSTRLRLTGMGLVAYSVTLAQILLPGAAPNLGPWVGLILLLLPAIFWIRALIELLPEEMTHRARLAELWRTVFWPAVLVVAAFDSGINVLFIAGAVVLLPMLALVGLVWWSARQQRTRQALALPLVFTIFLGLSLGLLLLPTGLLSSWWGLLLLGVDLIGLGLAIARFDAFDLGEALVPDMVRSFVAAGLAAVVLGGQVALAIGLATGPTLPMLVLLLATVATAIALATFADSLGVVLDWLALGRLPGVPSARADLRAVASALPRVDSALDLAALDEVELARLTRRALGHFGDLPRLAASPLTRLPLVERRLAVRGAPGDALERAAELKAVLAEGVARLKPRTGQEFGTSDEWRHYNALYFPYVVGLKPYSRRVDAGRLDPAAREALAWLRDSVPERTLYNWQTAAARLVAADLRARADRDRSSTVPEAIPTRAG